MPARFRACRVLPHASSATSTPRGNPGCRLGVFQPLRLRTTLPQLVHEVRGVTTVHASGCYSPLAFESAHFIFVGSDGLSGFRDCMDVLVRFRPLILWKKRQVASHAFGSTPVYLRLGLFMSPS